MPRTCQITGCIKTAKLVCDTTNPSTYMCQIKDDEHDQKRLGLIFKKLVNSPCMTCISLNNENVKEATFGPIIDGKLKRMYCKEHCNNVNFVVKKSLRRCEYSGCEVQPSFCAPGTTTRKFCKKHKPNDAVRSIISTGKTCKHEFTDKRRCQIQPSYGFSDDQRPSYCNEHRLEGMQNITDRNRRCEIKDCTVMRATYGLPLDKKPTRCSAHRTNAMIDIVNKKCVGCGLYVVTAKKNHLCSYCSEETVRMRQKEQTVFTILKDNFPDYTFIWNRAVGQDKSCALTRYRPDFCFDRGFYYLIVECDEDAHRQYDVECERKRMYEITGGLGLPVVFVRYNPDSFSINGTVSQCHHITKKRHLVNTVQKYLTTTRYDLFKRTTLIVHYLFYDTTMTDSYERVIGLEERKGTLIEI